MFCFRKPYRPDYFEAYPNFLETSENFSSILRVIFKDVMFFLYKKFSKTRLTNLATHKKFDVFRNKHQDNKPMQ